MDNSFFSCLCNIPVVSSAVCQVQKIYTHNKQRNGLTHVAFSAAELGLRTVLSVTQPLFNQLQEPMSRLSTVACQHLSDLQASYPFIQTPTYEILSASKQTLKEILGLSDADETSQQNEEENEESGTLDRVELSPGVNEILSSSGFRRLADHLGWMLTMSNFTVLYLHQHLFPSTGHIIQSAQSIFVVSALREVRKMVLCCSSCTPGWPFSIDASSDVSCVTCGINKHLLKTLKDNLILQGGSQKIKYLNGMMLWIIDWLINHSLLKLLTPELQIGRCRFEDDYESSPEGNDDHHDNEVFGYVPIHPLDLANIILQANHGRSFWKRMHS